MSQRDESGCETDMAEGGSAEEESSSDMLGPSLAPVLQSMQTPAPTDLTCKDEEESDCESSVSSPEPASMAMGSDTGQDLSIASRLQQSQPQQTHIKEEVGNMNNESKMMPPVSAASHLNGAMAGLVTLQNLQNLASLQGLPQVASLAAGLSSMTNIPGNPVVNAPLNLSISASAATPRCSSQHPLPPTGSCSTTNTTATMSSPPPPVMTPHQQQQPPPNHMMGGQQQPAAATPAPMPQLILASGQLVQGIQGAQLLIPTSQGLATQTILTIPVNHLNSSDQMVNLALNNGQVMQTSLANLQAMAQSNLLNPPAAAPPPLTPPTSNGTPGLNPNLLNPATLTHLLSNGSAQHILQTLPQILNTPPPNPPPLMNPLLSTPPQMMGTPSPLMATPTSQAVAVGSQRAQQMATSNHYVESKMQQRIPSPPTSCTGSSGGSLVSRMQSNGDVNVNVNAAHTGNITASQNVKRPPSAAASPTCTDSSTADLLVDSPNQPTINQTNSNVVDGINLDEIKDFAKAFKLRRLSLGLTQTQVGQALSVTEGPAYSQSAICSALASQMFAAAQLSSQQQAMFEKLDITPKSAQKIKPVLERWMKEAEDRYKSGQNHLTDFIGIEPSKKRKRRTSFTPQALELLNAHFERNTHPSGTEITGLAHQLGYEREVIRIWFCNKRQALKNTVRMMSKGMV